MNAPAAVAYRRLPGSTPWLRFGAMSGPATSLWLGPDHLLKIERGMSREIYKRFYYRDIQAVVIEQTTRRFVLTVIDLVAISLITLFALIFSRSAGSAVPYILVLSSPFLVGLIVNAILGRTSQGALVTAVGRERLSSLGRVDRAVQALPLIAAEVNRAQGELPTAQLLLHWPGGASAPVTH